MLHLNVVSQVKTENHDNPRINGISVYEVL